MNFSTSLVCTLLFVCTVAGWCADREDPLIAGARRALSQGQAVAAYQLIQEHAEVKNPGQACLIKAKALLAMGRGKEAQATLQVSEIKELAYWPTQWHSAVAAVIGEALAINGEPGSAHAWLTLALKRPGPDVAVDRVLLLLAETAEKNGKPEQAERLAHALWRDWPRSPYRAQAGLLEAQLLATRDPERARVILAGVRTLDHVSAKTHAAAAELLCKLLLEKQPAQCLAVAEQAIIAVGDIGSLSIYRALAMTVLDPQSGLAALEALPVQQRSLPVVQEAINRVQKQQGAALLANSNEIIARARAEIALGHSQVAIKLLEPIASQEPIALQVLSTIIGQSLEKYLETPAMRDAKTAEIVGIILAQQGNRERAWPLLETALKHYENSPKNSQQESSLLYWSLITAEQMAPARVASLRKQILSLPGQGLEIGLAWSAEAQRREQTQAPAEAIRSAWEKAAQALPNTHVYHPAAAWRAAKPLMESQLLTDLERARALLLPATTLGNSEDHRRCRFYLAQLYERMQRPQAALQLVESLYFGANSQQLESLNRLAKRLQQSISSASQSDPLDAEN